MDDVIDRAPVRIGGVEISDTDIAAEAQNHPAPDADAAWAAAAEALAIRQLLLAQADRLGIAAAALTDANGAMLTDDDARIDALLDREIKAPQATGAEARRFYDRHLDRFRSDTLVEAEHILLSASPADDLAYSLAMGDARTLINRIRDDPACFGALARAYSACPSKEHGGNLGQIGPGQTVRAFEDALFALGEGELASTPVRSPFGIHVVRAGRRAEGRQLPFGAVEATIRDYLAESSYRKAVAQYLAILAGETTVEGVDLRIAEGPLVQ